MQILLTALQLLLSNNTGLRAQFGDGITPNSDGVFAPPVLDNITVLSYTNSTISFLITLMTTLGGLFFLYQLSMGGINWLNAGGEQKKVQESRDRITQGVIGLIILVASYAVVGLIGTVFGIEILNPGQFVAELLGI